MKITGEFTKIEQGLFDEYKIISSSISETDFELILDNIEIYYNVNDIIENVILEYINYNNKIYPNSTTLIKEYYRNPSSFYEIIFPFMRENLSRERYILNFITPKKTKITIEYLLDYKEESHLDDVYIYLFTPESHLLDLNVYVNDKIIGPVSSIELKKIVNEKIKEKINSISLLLKKYIDNYNINLFKDEELIKLILNHIWNRKGVSPLCIKLSSEVLKVNPNIIKIVYYDTINIINKEDAILKKITNLWNDYEAIFNLKIKSKISPIWIFSYPPKDFHIETSIYSKMEDLILNNNENERKLDLFTIADSESNIYRLSDSINSQDQKLKLSYTHDGIFINNYIQVPKSLRRWLFFTYWISFFGAFFPIIILLLKLSSFYISVKSIDYFINLFYPFLKNHYSIISIFIMSLIITARSWLIYEETTFEIFSNKITIIATLVFLLLVLILILPNTASLP